MSIRLQSRDYEIFRHMATFGFVTVNQLCALVEPNGSGPNANLWTYKNGIYIRLAALQREGLISSGHAPSLDGKTVSAYFLAPKGASLLSDLREYEYLNTPRWLEKKSHFVWVQGPHDMAACNFVANLLALSRIVSSFTLGFWRASRDCRFYVFKNDTKHIFNPDLYMDFRWAGGDPIPMFVEIDTGHVNLTVIRRKAIRAFQYYGSGKFIEDLGSELFPRNLFICRSAARLAVIARELQDAREKYQGPDASLVRSFPVWLTTFDDVCIEAIDQGTVSNAPLCSSWRTLDGEKGVTPFKE